MPKDFFWVKKLSVNNKIQTAIVQHQVILLFTALLQNEITTCFPALNKHPT